MHHPETFHNIMIKITAFLIEHCEEDDLIGCCRMYNRSVKHRNVYKLKVKDFNFLSKVLYKYRRLIIDYDMISITNFVELMFLLLKLGDRKNSTEDLNNLKRRFLSDINLSAPSPDPESGSPLKSPSAPNISPSVDLQLYDDVKSESICEKGSISSDSFLQKLCETPL